MTQQRRIARGCGNTHTRLHRSRQSPLFVLGAVRWTLFRDNKEFRDKNPAPFSYPKHMLVCLTGVCYNEWVIKKTVKHQKGYILVYRPEHPMANSHGRVPEHRLVIEKKIGRYVNVLIEDVHHIDENVQNNHPDNLMLVSKQDHRRIHYGWRKIDGAWHKTCSQCKKELDVEKNFYKRGRGGYVFNCIRCVQIRGKERGQFPCPTCGKDRWTSVAQKKSRCISCAMRSRWERVGKSSLKISYKGI